MKSWTAPLILVISSLVVPDLAEAQQAAGRDPVSIDISGLPSADVKALTSGIQSKPVPGSTNIIVDRADFVKKVRKLYPEKVAAGAIRPFIVSADPAAMRFERNVTVQQIYPPTGGAALINKNARDLLDCRSAACSTSGSLATLSNQLRVIDQGCSSAASRFSDAADLCKDSACPTDWSSTRKSFDDFCLSSSLPWWRPDGTFRSDEVPGYFRSGGDVPGASGIWDAVGLIEIKSTIVREPICGALLLSGNRILTARHCFGSRLASDALDDGSAQVRLIRSGTTYELLPDSGQSFDPVAPADDYVVLRFRSSVPVAAPLIVFRAPEGPEKAVVIGYFADFDSTRRLTDSSLGNGVSAIPTWRQALRWPRDGLCHVLPVAQGCVKSMCETVEGYSGAPVFSASGTSAAPLIVYGLVSGADQVTSNCGVADKFWTILSSASGVIP